MHTQSRGAPRFSYPFIVVNPFTTWLGRAWILSSCSQRLAIAVAEDVLTQKLNWLLKIRFVEFQKHVNQEKPDIKEYILYDLINMKSKNRKH